MATITTPSRSFEENPVLEISVSSSDTAKMVSYQFLEVLRERRNTLLVPQPKFR